MPNNTDILKTLREVATHRVGSIGICWDKWSDNETDMLISELSDRTVGYSEALLSQLLAAGITDTRILSCVADELINSYMLEELIHRATAIHDLTT